MPRLLPACLLPACLLLARLLLTSLLLIAGSIGTAPTKLLADDHGHSHPRFSTTRPAARVLPLPKEDDCFHFLIYGDRTGGVPEGLKVLEQAVVDSNLLDPDLVMTVGDLIQGYNEQPEWLFQMNRYKKIMARLKMPWYPVAGNHDIYWRGKGPAPQGHHEAVYEKHFGPLWYSFAHKNAAFIVLYTDEGDSSTNAKGYHQPKLRQMSNQQLDFLASALGKHENADHVFVFVHHPRWIQSAYQGSNWETVHGMLRDAGNVSAVFAGHIHQMHYGGTRDGIAYHTLATTGGGLSAEIPGAGLLHHMNMVTVRKDRISVSALPVGAVIDPKQFTMQFITQIDRAREITPVISSDPIDFQIDGSADSDVSFELTNTSDFSLSVNWNVDTDRHWRVLPQHGHVKLRPGAKKSFSIKLVRQASNIQELTVPKLSTQIDVVAPTARIALPVASTTLPVRLAAVPADYFVGNDDRCLKVSGPETVASVDSSQLRLPDGPMTVEAWLRPRQLAGNCAAVAKTQLSEFAIFIDEGVPQFDVYLDGRYVTARAQDVLTVDRWTHVAGVYDGSATKIYVDGKQVGMTKGSGVRKTNQLPLFIGGDPNRRGQATRTFPGDIDEVRISKQAVYDNDFQPRRRLTASDPTILMLHFDKPLGPFVLDQSPQAAKATLAPSAVLTPSALPLTY